MRVSRYSSHIGVNLLIMWFAGFVTRTSAGVSPAILLPRSTRSAHITAKSSSGFVVSTLSVSISSISFFFF